MHEMQVVRGHVSHCNHAVMQVWLLNGGPGTPGQWFLPFAALPLPHPAFAAELLLPDHRGTGKSHELACADGSQHIDQQCIDGLRKDPTLQHFTISNAARFRCFCLYP